MRRWLMLALGLSSALGSGGCGVALAQELPGASGALPNAVVTGGIAAIGIGALIGIVFALRGQLFQLLKPELEKLVRQLFAEMLAAEREKTKAERDRRAAFDRKQEALRERLGDGEHSLIGKLDALASADVLRQLEEVQRTLQGLSEQTTAERSRNDAQQELLVQLQAAQSVLRTDQDNALRDIADRMGPIQTPLLELIGTVEGLQRDLQVLLSAR